MVEAGRDDEEIGDDPQDASDGEVTGRGSGPETVDPAPGPDPAARRRLAGIIAWYTAERLGLTAVLAALLALFMPLLVALAFAIVLQMPLAFVLFRRTRERLGAALAVTNAQRRSERDRLRAALAGEAEPGER
jgi:hypothetical protein